MCVRWRPACVLTIRIVLLTVLGVSVKYCRSQDLDAAVIHSTAMELHKKFSDIRKNDYGNVHLVYQFIEKGSNGYYEEKVVRYWARDNQYFRVDEQTIADGKPSEHYKLIVRPGRYVRLKRTEQGDAITALGSFEDGIEALSVYEFYAASTRYDRVLDGEVPWGYQDDVEYSTEASSLTAKVCRPLKMERKGGELALTSQWDWGTLGDESVTGSMVGRITYDLSSAVVLSYEQLESTMPNGYAFHTVTKEYDVPRSRHIPTKIVRDIKTAKEDVWSKVEYTLEEIDWSPVPDGIFAVEGMELSRGGTWTRRLAILGIAIALVAAYGIYRRLSGR
ncbi:MAG: hypothetical protein KatS3mg111_3995 [Pirellulaceae bacterium]|nr:MAG: hypothetical protein KatS3mg111_0454 [Pirellulaceae bacterium]GIX00663.1 MAG: hypothetical protein KatS3mg111_3995 [Pirellulaceae bacterium]